MLFRSGLKVPLSTFLIEEETKYTIIDQKKEEPILSEKGKMRAYTIFLYDPLRNFETFYIEFDSECKHTSSVGQSIPYIPTRLLALILVYPPELDRRYTEDNICFTQRNGELNLVMAWKFPTNCDVYTTGDIHLLSSLD